jgi:hypothetical protein
MAFTLAQYKAFTTEAKSPVIIDELRRNSWLLDNMPFTDNGAVMAGKWVYSYSRRESSRGAAVRLVNTEYTPAIVTAPVPYTAELAIFGGSYTIDRVMGDGPANASIITEQEEGLITATTEKWADLLINGDASNAGEFDGLDVALAGSSTEFNADGVVNLYDETTLADNADSFRLKMMQFLKLLDGRVDAFLVNGSFFPNFSWMVSKWGQYSNTADDFGNEYSRWGTIPFIDIGEKSGSSDPVIPVETRTVATVETEGLTDIYAVRFGPQALHGVSPNDKSRLIRVYEPDFERPGAVHLGEVEMVATMALEATRAAGVFRNIKVQPDA